jgi:hypothetical protein
MPRAAHSTILNTYDRLMAQVQAQSENARFTPEEAEAAAKAAHAAGRHDEEALINDVFAELRAVEFKGGHVTTADVARGREYIEALLDEVDRTGSCNPRNNGLSNAELAILGPIAEALVQSHQLTKILETSKPGRESKDYLFNALDKAADLLKSIDGGNNRLSPEELLAGLEGVDANVAYLARSLYATAKGTEKAGGHIGAEDIDRAVAIHRSNIEDRDVGGPGFDNNELRALPPMYKTAYVVGRAMEAGVID